MFNVISDNPYIGTGVKQKIIDEFTYIYNPGKRIAFYPSSHLSIDRVLDFNCDINIFADYGFNPRHWRGEILRDPRPNEKFRQSGISIIKETDEYIYGMKSGQAIYLIYLDNNEVLELISRFYKFINVYIGVADGCCEGGNYECVNSLPFFEKVVKLASPLGLDLYIDHSGFLDQYPQYIFGNLIVHSAEILSDLRLGHTRWPTRHYIVSPHKPLTYVWKYGQIKLTVEFDNILNHLSEMDGIFCSPLCCMIAKHFYGISNKKVSVQKQFFFKPSTIPGWSANDSFKLVLDQAKKYNWATVGITAFGEQNHKEFLDILKSRSYKEPTWIRLFHLQDDDFSELKKQMVFID